MGRRSAGGRAAGARRLFPARAHSAHVGRASVGTSQLGASLVECAHVPVVAREPVASGRKLSRIVIIGALPQSLVNFRGDLIEALTAAGHEVTAMAGAEDPRVIARLSEMGARFEAFPVQ